jgi:hypothetical protein
LLSRADVSRHTDGLALLHELRAALVALPAIPARFEREGSGPLRLFDPEGALLAELEVGGLFSLRASLLAAIAVDVLSPPEAKRVAILGSGVEASTALKALRLVRSLREVWLCGPATIDESFVEAAGLQLSLKTPVRAVERAAAAVENAEVVVLTGGVTLPETALWPSVQVSIPSAARFAAAPLSTGLLAKAWRVSDSPGVQWGHAIHAQLGAVLSGAAKKPDTSNPIFLGGDAAALDLVAAWHVYLGARGELEP